MLLGDYGMTGYFDEMFDDDARPRPEYADVAKGLSRLSSGAFAQRSAAIDRHYESHGITFSHGGEAQTFPFDLVPRVIPAAEWEPLAAGLRQRVVALEHFLDDIYWSQRVICDGVVPNALLANSNGYFREAVGIASEGRRRIALAGVDLIRDDVGVWRVLEDNLRNPSGMSYLVQNRMFMRRMFPEAFADQCVAQVDHAALLFRDALREMSPAGADACIVVLSPGSANAAYAEHAFLAAQMGAELVEGSDLFVRNRQVRMRTTMGPKIVDVIYRRIDDTYLDPASLRGDSLLGVPGLMQAYRDGNVTIANAPGNGIADDKALYVYVPDLIRYYMAEEPILQQVPTFMLDRPEKLKRALDNLDSLVVKAVDGAGGYGMLIGPHATPAERDAFARVIVENPRGYIAQEVVNLSRAPVFIDGKLAARHVDLRPFVIYGHQPVVVPGGLTRVALREGSLVVNSSQGGGSKDTWVVGGS